MRKTLQMRMPRSENLFSKSVTPHKPALKEALMQDSKSPARKKNKANDELEEVVMVDQNGKPIEDMAPSAPTMADVTKSGIKGLDPKGNKKLVAIFTKKRGVPH